MIERIEKIFELSLATVLVLLLIAVPAVAGYNKVSQRNIVMTGYIDSELFVNMTGYSGSIEIIAQSGFLSLVNTPDTYGFGIISASSTNGTGLDYFTMENTGGVPANVTIGATNMTGSGTTWILDNDAVPGDSICGMKAGLNGTSYNIIVKRDIPHNNLKTGLSISSTEDWGLQLLAPTVIPSGAQVSNVVTLTVVAS